MAPFIVIITFASLISVLKFQGVTRRGPELRDKRVLRSAYSVLRQSETRYIVVSAVRY
ncbi:hypothetical protein DI53_2526 [Sphingobacterium deserti]|uniref:Uncharacterized protein n=1 Tax=Sphingobacterium deserti TaxID=1229276 RepID=A0A0B8T3N9_9SPHI|nr:hypothetical protein DI53_2526 [Sphingobacterium deserti]